MTNIKSNDTLSHFDQRANYWNQLYKRPQFQDRLSLFANGIKNNLSPQSPVLDYGCGTGRIAIELATYGYKIKGVDGSGEMIEKARCEAINRKLSSVSFEVINPTTWRPQEQYEAIICSSVIEYVPDDTSLLSLFADALSPSGILMISVPYAYSIPGKVEDLFHFYRNMVTTRSRRDVQFSQRRYTRTSLTQKLIEAGFDKPKWTSFEFPVFNQLGIRLSRIPFLGIMLLAHTHRNNKQHT